ncbi:MAG: phosphonate ABC transporter, permease protein PhnE, partial [Pseudomonadota bacterium]
MTDISQIPRAPAPTRFERPSALSFLGYAAGVAIIIWCFAGAGFSIEKMVTSPPRFADFLTRAFPPNLEPQTLTRLGWKMVETLQIA